MADPSIVVSERYPIGGHRYDLSVLRDGENYYATWFCEYCPARGKAAEYADHEAARAAGVAAIKAHHAARHE